MADDVAKITVETNGPYLVQGRVPLVRKESVDSEFGEPLTWRKTQVLRSEGTYLLCRCGKSSNKPFCDDSHEDVGFDGTEMAEQGQISERQKIYEGTKIVMKDDRSICTHAGFCGNRIMKIWEMIPKTDDTQIRAQVMAMIERCPSGSLSYSLEPEGENIEPDLPLEVAVTPDGPLWVTGNVLIQRSDGQPCEVRNRVTLSRCGASKKKPLCDGTHKEIGFSAK